MSGRIVRLAVGKSPRAIDSLVRGLAHDAYRHVSHIRQWFDRAGLRPQDVRRVADLERLPIGFRYEMSEAESAASLRGGRRLATWRSTRTSGTTGVPMTIFMSRSEALYRRLLLFRVLGRYRRFRFPFTIAEVGAGTIHLASRRSDLTQRIELERLTKTARTSPPEAQVEVLLDARPQVLPGHPSCLLLAADEIRKRGRPPEGWPFPVVARGEILAEEARRGGPLSWPSAAASPRSATAKKSGTSRGSARGPQGSCTSTPTRACWRSSTRTADRQDRARGAG